MGSESVEGQGANAAGELRYLGGGGTSTTYVRERIHVDGLTQRSCVKIIKPELQSDPDFMRLLRREAAIGVTLRHRNIVSLLEVDLGQGQLVFEFIEGANLRQILRSKADRRLSTEVTVYIAMCLVEALEYAHGQHVVHRDLSADNVMVSSNGEVKLLDFGVATLKRGAADPKTLVRGKMPYMAPEYARNEEVDGRVDLFALGVLCYELLVGRRPARGSDLEIYHQLLHRTYPPLRDASSSVPMALAQLVNQLLEPDRDKRIASAAECFDALEPLAPSPAIRRELALLARSAAADAARSAGRQRGLAGKPALEELPMVEQSTKELPTVERSTMFWAKPHEDQSYPVSARLKQLIPVTAVVALAALATSAVLTRDRRAGVPMPLATESAAVMRSSEIQAEQVTDARKPSEPIDRAAGGEAFRGARVGGSIGPAAVGGEATLPVSPLPATREKARDKMVRVGVIQIGVAPASNVWIDGKRVGVSPLELRLAVGKHVVGAGDKRPEVTKSISVRAGNNEDVYIDLSAGEL